MRVKAQSYPTNAATCMKVLANGGVAASHKTLQKKLIDITKLGSDLCAPSIIMSIRG